MQPTQTSESHRIPEVEPAIRHVVPWHVTSVSANANLCLHVTFVDGTTGEVDLRNFLNSPKIAGTIFEPLRDEEAFSKVEVVIGAIQWANGADLAPDVMYDAIKSQGQWIVE
ncbi:DUF2442 domain-containing protein [Nitrospira sp. M1]